MKKNKIIICIFIAVLLSSCKNSPQEQAPEYMEDNEKVITNESEPSKYSAKGKVIKIDENGLHIQDKDKVDVYNVDPERTRSLFIGEYVGINKLEGDKFDAVLEGNHDYNARVTAEGKAITRINGTVGEVSKDNVTVITDKGEIKLSKARDFDLKKGDHFIADYVELAGSNQMIAFFDEASKISVTVKEVSRDINGMMRIYALSDGKVEYDIMVGADTITNFIHSSLEPNDGIVVYPNNISGDVPALVDAKLILLNHEEDKD